MNPFYGTFAKQFIIKGLASENFMKFLSDLLLFRSLLRDYLYNRSNRYSSISFMIVLPMSLHKIKSFLFTISLKKVKKLLNIYCVVYELAIFCLKVTENTLRKDLHNIEKDNTRYKLFADFWLLFRFPGLFISFLPTEWVGLL